MAEATRSSVAKAAREFKHGDRPFRFSKARSWYVVLPNAQLYPLKYIYAIAAGKTPSSFNTSEAISKLNQLGFKMLHLPNDSTATFEEKVKAALKDPKARRRRLLKAPKKPALRSVTIVSFERNPDVVAEVLAAAKGICGLCGKKAPFTRRTDGTPYLEVHHRIQLAHGGEDTVENAVAACPNCHRRAHHG